MEYQMSGVCWEIDCCEEYVQFTCICDIPIIDELFMD